MFTSLPRKVRHEDNVMFLVYSARILLVNMTNQLSFHDVIMITYAQYNAGVPGNAVRMVNHHLFIDHNAILATGSPILEIPIPLIVYNRALQM